MAALRANWAQRRRERRVRHAQHVEHRVLQIGVHPLPLIASTTAGEVDANPVLPALARLEQARQLEVAVHRYLAVLGAFGQFRAEEGVAETRGMGSAGAGW